MRQTEQHTDTLTVRADTALQSAYLDRNAGQLVPKCVFRPRREDSDVCNELAGLNRPADTISVPAGRSGIYEAPFPYRIYRDDLVSGTLLLCFFLLMFVWAGGRRFFIEQAKNFFFSRRRHSMTSSQETGREMRYMVFLMLQTCIMMGFFTFGILLEQPQFRPDDLPRQAFLGICVGAYVAYYIGKLLLYAIVNGTFFDKETQGEWTRSYLLTVSLEGIFLFPLVVLSVYFDLSSSGGLIYLIIVHSLVEISLFYKCFSLFFRDIHGGFHLIMYFCALELVPMSLLWYAVVHMSRMNA